MDAKISANQDEPILNQQHLSLSANDYFDFNMYVFSTEKSYRKKMLLTWLLITVFCFAAAAILYFNGHLKHAVYCGAFGGATVLFYPSYFKYRHIRHFKKQSQIHYQSKVNMPIEFLLRSNFCEWKTTTASSQFLYANFERIIELDRIYLVMMGNKQGLLIPKRCIIDESKWRTDLKNVSNTHGLAWHDDSTY